MGYEQGSVEWIKDRLQREMLPDDKVNLHIELKRLYPVQFNLAVEELMSVVHDAPDESDKQQEMVDHPAHYGGGDNPYEAIKVIEAWRLGFCLGNVVKYISRHQHKGVPLEDLKKARWYLDREIQNQERNVYNVDK